MHRILISGFALLVSFAAGAAHADRRGQAAVAVEDDVPVYETSTSRDPHGYLWKGQPFAAERGPLSVLTPGPQHIFDEKDGRVFGRYFPSEEQKGKWERGWVDPGRLEKFYYDCSCGRKEGDCDPTEVRGLRFSFIWNSCFLEAWEAKKEELEEASAPPPQETAEDRLARLRELFEEGLITKEEYEAKRSEILDDL